MDIDKFIEKLSYELDDIPPEQLRPDTGFRELDHWSSMHVLMLIAFVDAEYNVTIGSTDLNNAQTIQDLYNIVVAKIPA